MFVGYTETAWGFGPGSRDLGPLGYDFVSRVEGCVLGVMVSCNAYRILVASGQQLTPLR